MGVDPKRRLLVCVSVIAMAANSAAPAIAWENDSKTKTPIKHVMIIVGENRTLDHLFATYVPPSGTMNNLLSEGIVNADGTSGPNANLASQYSAMDKKKYSIHPHGKQPYAVLPPAMTDGAPEKAQDPTPGLYPNLPFATLGAAAAYDQGLEPADLPLLLTGATGLPTKSVDTRIANATALPNAPYPLAPGIGYDDFAASPVHRFYQMFQQMDCSAAKATKVNPSGCLNDLFPWVEVTVGAGSNGAPQPAGFTDQTTGEGSTSMGFYNVQRGDMPYFKSLADEYAIGDNYHQPIKGGTGANSVVLGFADLPWYTDGKGDAAVPPDNQIENPNPQPGTNNYYIEDGYGASDGTGGGSYSECTDPKHPGVGPILEYLSDLPYPVKANCESGHYYLLNNYNPGYNGDGTVNTSSPFTIPPSPIRSIANTLDEAKVSWRYYGEDWNNFTTHPKSSTYCNICNPFLYQTYVMTDAAKRQDTQKDTSDLYDDIKSGKLPAVSYVKPSSLNDGHPASSKYNIFEAFTKKIVDLVKANPELWASTAIFITNDEGGGYYDAGFIQALDFFGDGTRIPLIVVSPYSKEVGVVHSYGDHASILKFINANWNLPPITEHSRDNLPNPKADDGNPYVPTNMPAIGDLMDFFKF